jgi:hypothetical protein
LLKDEGLRQRLLRAETASEFLEALAEAEGKLA